MRAVQFRPGSPEQIDSLTNGVVLAVDLGFSKKSKSCALAWREDSGMTRSEGFRFGDCVKVVAGMLEGYPSAVLIIEAPLSGKFTSSGNPVERGELERRGPTSSDSSTRYWYVGAGGTMCLAVIFVLRDLLAEVVVVTFLELVLHNHGISRLVLSVKAHTEVPGSLLPLDVGKG